MTARISFLANNGDVGGGEVMLLAMATVARDAGLDVEVVGPAAPDALAVHARAAGFTYRSVGGRNRRAYLRHLIADRRRPSSDLVWCNGLLPAVAMIGARARRVMHLHQTPAGMQRLLARLACRGAAAVVVPSAAVRGVPTARVLPNWTADVDPTDLPSRQAGTDATFRVGFIGRFSQDKGLDVLADAIAGLQRSHPGRFRLVLAGDDRFVDAAQSAAVATALRGVDNIDRLGWVDPAAFFGAVDVVAIPSVWAEPFGLVAAEAMAARRPVLVSDAGALPTVVGASHPWVIPHGDAAALRDAILTIADADPGAIATTCAAARARWEEHFSPAAGAQRFLHLLKDLGVEVADHG